MDAQKVAQFDQMMTHERVNGNSAYESELKKGYRDILLGMIANYSEYRAQAARFLSSLETNNIHSLPYSLDVFFELSDLLIKTGDFELFDLSILIQKVNANTVTNIKSVLEAALSKGQRLRLSEDNFDISFLSDQDKKEIATLIIKGLHQDAEKVIWDKDMVENSLMQLVLLRQTLVILGRAELFYHAIGLFFDRLISSEFYQTARDLAEEVIWSSYKDQIPEHGYFNSFRIYSLIGSIHASLFYANLSLTSILQKNPPYSEKYIKEIIWQGMKFFRNVNLFPWANRLYNSIPNGLSFLDFERRSLDHTYFSLLLKSSDATLPSLFLDYLHKEREGIISGGVNEVAPWLVTLYNIKIQYEEADFGPMALGYYLRVFELIVPVEILQRHKEIIEGVSPDLKNYLKASLVKLNETRHEADFVYDNESAIRISNRLIKYSTEVKDASAFLLSMLLKSDFSILFRRKESRTLGPMILPEIDVTKLETLYDDKNAFLSVFSVDATISMNWLAISNERLYQLQLYNHQYYFFLLNDWVNSSFESLTYNDFFVDLVFSESVRDRGGVRLVSVEEFEEEEIKVLKKIEIAKLFIAKGSEGVYVVKDMKISNFPHNLFLDETGEFIAKSVPVTNVLSTEWLLAQGSKNTIHLKRKAIWIPVESGDLTLNYLFSNIESTLNTLSFKILKMEVLVEPLSSDINIVCSHGAKNISDVQVVSQEGNLVPLDAVIGEGQVLIFFVCYSGSMKADFFRNNVTSLVKQFIAHGYKAVIAPFWALHVNVPRYWLPEFFAALNSGLDISQAVFNANRKVYEHYPTPAAWACLHLYGNPKLKVLKD